MLSLGSYPEVSLAAARDTRAANKSLLSNGIDPSIQRRLARTAERTAERIPSDWSPRNCSRNLNWTATIQKRSTRSDG
ncbi:Arm DNA-binding domain-containing protein [Nitrobacter sp. 62-23]|uniref:Arm DNA-binding domain-containing protein n=1 Tax=unclassified Nitrobacter TaxID=2620411 RepID=UPI003444B3DB